MNMLGDGTDGYVEFTIRLQQMFFSTKSCEIDIGDTLSISIVRLK